MNAKPKDKDKNAHKNFTDKVMEFKKALDNDAETDLNILEEDAEPRADYEKLAGELEESKKLCVEYLDKLRRNMAEFDNYRKRTTKEKAGMYDEGVKDTVEKLVPILDNFELALNAAMNKEDNFYKGVEMILRQFTSVMLDLGVEEISALGAAFDPNVHNAVLHVVDEAFGENEVIEEMRKGYKYKDKVLRHSMVKVAN